MNNLDSIKRQNSNNSIRLNGAKNDLAVARSFVSKFLDKSKFDKRDAHLLMLAVDEAISRSISSEGDYDINLQVDVNETCFKAEVIDSNNDYAIDFSSAAGFSNNWRKEQSKNDLSIYVILEIMDEVKYVYRRGYNNILTLIKFVPADK